MKKVLVTGCLGQIGSELITRLRQELGSENVIATDIRMPEVIEKNDIFEILDVMDYENAQHSRTISSGHIDSFGCSFVSCCRSKTTISLEFERDWAGQCIGSR